MKINYSFHSDNWDIVPARMGSLYHAIYCEKYVYIHIITHT